MTMTFKAGIALAALTGVVGLAGTAGAADLGGMSGGSMKDGGYMAPMPQVSRGPSGPCYFRADVGYSASADPTATWAVTENIFTENGAGDGVVTADEITSNYLGNAVANEQLENSWFGEVGAGCGTGGSRGVRGELMLGYHGKKKFDGEPIFYDPGPEVGGPEPGAPEIYDDPAHTDITSYTLMLNFYKDLGTYRGFTPYVGAGVGAAYNIADEFYFTENPNLLNRIRGDRDLSFAWALMAGVGYQVSDRTTLDVGYRYLDLGEAGSENVDNLNFYNPRFNIDDITAHEVKVGLRYSFGSSDCCSGGDYVPMK